MAGLLPSAEGDNGTIMLYLDGGKTTRPYSPVSLSFRLDDKGVAVVCHNQEKNLHALTQNQQMEYYLVLEHCGRSEEVKCVLWTAKGTRSFGSGAVMGKGDLAIQLDDAALEQYRARGRAPAVSSPPDIALKRMTLRFWDFPKPIVGAINGLAVGGHANVALANFFDIVFASSEARFKYPFVKLGLTPELGSSAHFPRVVGMARAKHIMLAGDWFYSPEAKSWGLVNEVYAPEELFPAALAYARKLAASNQTALRLGKRVLNSHLRRDLDQVMDVENKTILESVMAMGGFGGKRKKKKAKL